MGTSNWQHISYCSELLFALQPKSILDIGIGFGRYGILAREMCDVWRGRPTPNQWQVEIVGVEAFDKLIRDYHSVFYNRIIAGDAFDVLKEAGQRHGLAGKQFDLAILGDVLEHFERQRAEDMLQMCRAAALYTMVAVPIGSDWQQADLYGNPYERHRSTWRHRDFRKLGPVCFRFFRDYIGRRHAVYVFPSTSLDAQAYWRSRAHDLPEPSWPELLDLYPEGRPHGALPALRRRLHNYPLLESIVRRPYSAAMNARAAFGAAEPPAPPAGQTGGTESAQWEIRNEAVKVLAVTPPGWFGVTTSTRNNFPNLLLCPEHARKPEKVADEILRRGFSTIVFMDAVDVFETIARRLRTRVPSTRLLAHYHGSLAQNVQPLSLHRFKRLLSLAREGLIEKVGCAKAGMAPALEALGVRASYLPYRVEPPAAVVHRPAGSPRRIGLFLRDILRKNARTQFMAACMLRDIEIHANEAPDLSYLRHGPPVVLHGDVPYAAFLDLLGDMDVCLYVSLSECYPMVVAESLIRGVPCLTSRTHEIFEGDSELARELIVDAYDNPVAIAEQAEHVLKERGAIGRRCEVYARELNRRAESALNEFVGCNLHSGEAAKTSDPTPVVSPAVRVRDERSGASADAQGAAVARGATNWQHSAYCAEILFALAPKSILDVGLGFGRYGILGREVCDVWRQNVFPEEWKAEIIGVPGPDTRAQDYQSVFYNQISGDAPLELLRRTPHHFDLVILDGVLEHLSHEHGEEVLDLARAKAHYVMLCVPHGPEWHASGHRSRWLHEEVAALLPVCRHWFRDHLGRRYAVYVLASTHLDQQEYWRQRRRDLIVPSYRELADLYPKSGVRGMLPALRSRLRRYPRVEFVARKAYRVLRRVPAAGAGQAPSARLVRPSGLRFEFREPSVPVLAVVPPGWYGVTTSTRNNFPNLALCPEDLYEPERAAEEILAKGPETVVFSGMTDVSERIARRLRERSPGTRRLVHYHGSLSQSAQPEIRRQLRCVLNLAREGAVEKVGCAKAGMAPALQAMGADASYLPYRILGPGGVAHRPAGSPRRVGVFVRNILLKNVHTQFVAASMVSNVEMHANRPPDLSYFPRRPRIVAHGDMPYAAFLKVVGEMDLNLYVSLSECYPMLVVESLIRGVPCLTSHSHEVFEHDRELGQKLIVTAHDNPAAIAEQAETVLAEREAIGRRCAGYAVELNARAEALLNEFVGHELYGADSRPGEGSD